MARGLLSPRGRFAQHNAVLRRSSKRLMESEPVDFGAVIRSLRKLEGMMTSEDEDDLYGHLAMACAAVTTDTEMTGEHGDVKQ